MCTLDNAQNLFSMSVTRETLLTLADFGQSSPIMLRSSTSASTRLNTFSDNRLSFYPSSYKPLHAMPPKQCSQVQRRSLVCSTAICTLLFGLAFFWTTSRQSMFAKPVCCGRRSCQSPVREIVTAGGLCLVTLVSSLLINYRSQDSPYRRRVRSEWNGAASA